MGMLKQAATSLFSKLFISLFLLLQLLPLSLLTEVTYGSKCTIRRACDPTLHEAGCNTQKRKFIIFGNDGSGIGNQLVFFPSVFALAVGQGRQILLEDGTVIAKLCALQNNCHFRTVHNATLTYPSLSKSIHNVRSVKTHDFIGWSNTETKDKNIDAWPDVVVRSAGFLENLGWWAHSTTLSECISATPNPNIGIAKCCKLCLPCTASQSLKYLFPDWPSQQALHLFNTSVIVPQSQQDVLLDGARFVPPNFDVGIHLR